MRIGYASTSYPSRRNILGAVPGAEYRRVLDLYRLLGIACAPLRYLTGRSPSVARDLSFKFRESRASGADLIHLFNAVSHGWTPWITTFETVVPRCAATLACHHGPQPGFEGAARVPAVRRGVEALADDRCRRLIALSECAAAMQRELLVQFPDLRDRVERKLTTLPPPQAPLVAGARGLTGPVRFLFVGAAFFRKGGLETLETLQRLRDHDGCDLELTIVSSLAVDDYAASEGPGEVRRARELIRRGEGWVRHFPNLPNPEVLELMKAAHVGLLPTYADTYGYVVLEFQAAGCPVVTTDVRALPEINDNETGWVIRVPKNRLGEAIYTTADDRRTLSARIREGLERAVHEIFADRGCLAAKGERALRRIRDHHALEAFAERLGQIYTDAI